MDFHSMKRKELQALCKKHSIPANLTNLEMANRLTSLLKENEKPKTRGRSCLKDLDEIASVNHSDLLSRPQKKVKFSPENELFEYTKSDPREKRRMARRKSRLRPVEEIKDLNVEIVDRLESNEDIVKNPVRATRSRAHSLVNDGLVSIMNPPVEKKRWRKPVRKVVDLYDDSVEEEIKLPTRTKEVVHLGVVSVQNPVVKRGRKRGIDRIEPQSSVVVLSENSDAEEEQPGMPIGRSLRNRKVVVNSKKGTEGEGSFVTRKNTRTRTSTRMAKSGDEIPEKEGIEFDRVTVELEKALTRTKRNEKKGKESELLSGDSAKVEVLGRQKTNTETEIEVRREADVVLQVKEPLRRTGRNSNKRKSIMPRAVNEDKIERNGKKAEESEALNGDLGEVEPGRGKITRSRAQLGAKVSVLVSKSKTETEIEVHREAEVLHIEEQLRRSVRSNNRRKSTNEDRVEIPQLEDPVRRLVRNVNRHKSVLPQVEKVKANGPSTKNNRRSHAKKQVSFEDKKADNIKVHLVEISASKFESLETENREQEMEISVKENLNMSPEVGIEKSVEDYVTKGVEDDLVSHSQQKTGEKYSSNSLVRRETVKDLNGDGVTRFALSNSVGDVSLGHMDLTVKLKETQTEEELGDLNGTDEPVMYESVIVNHSGSSNENGDSNKEDKNISEAPGEAISCDPFEEVRITLIAQENNDFEDTETFVEAGEPHEHNSGERLQDIAVEVPLTNKILTIKEPIAPNANTLSLPEEGEPVDQVSRAELTSQFLNSNEDSNDSETMQDPSNSSEEAITAPICGTDCFLHDIGGNNDIRELLVPQELSSCKQMLPKDDSAYVEAEEDNGFVNMKHYLVELSENDEGCQTKNGDSAPDDSRETSGTDSSNKGRSAMEISQEREIDDTQDSVDNAQASHAVNAKIFAGNVENESSACRLSCVGPDPLKPKITSEDLEANEYPNTRICIEVITEEAVMTTGKDLGAESYIGGAAAATDNREQEMGISVKENLNMSTEVIIEKSVEDYVTKGVEDDLVSYSPQKTGKYHSNSLLGWETVKDLNGDGVARFALANSVGDGLLGQMDSIVKLKGTQTEKELEDLNGTYEPVMHESVMVHHSEASNESGDSKKDDGNIPKAPREATSCVPIEEERIASITQENNDAEETENFEEAGEPHELNSRERIQDIAVEVSLTVEVLTIEEPIAPNVDNLSLPEEGGPVDPVTEAEMTSQFRNANGDSNRSNMAMQDPSNTTEEAFTVPLSGIDSFLHDIGGNNDNMVVLVPKALSSGKQTLLKDDVAYPVGSEDKDFVDPLKPQIVSEDQVKLKGTQTEKELEDLNGTDEPAMHESVIVNHSEASNENGDSNKDDKNVSEAPGEACSSDPIEEVKITLISQENNDVEDTETFAEAGELNELNSRERIQDIDVDSPLTNKNLIIEEPIAPNADTLSLPEEVGPVDQVSEAEMTSQYLNSNEDSTDSETMQDPSNTSEEAIAAPLSGTDCFLHDTGGINDKKVLLVPQELSSCEETLPKDDLAYLAAKDNNDFVNMEQYLVELAENDQDCQMKNGDSAPDDNRETSVSDSSNRARSTMEISQEREQCVKLKNPLGTPVNSTHSNEERFNQQEPQEMVGAKESENENNTHMPTTGKENTDESSNKSNEECQLNPLFSSPVSGSNPCEEGAISVTFEKTTSKIRNRNLSAKEPQETEGVKSNEHEKSIHKGNVMPTSDEEINGEENYERLQEDLFKILFSTPDNNDMSREREIDDIKDSVDTAQVCHVVNAETYASNIENTITDGFLYDLEVRNDTLEEAVPEELSLSKQKLIIGAVAHGVGEENDTLVSGKQSLVELAKTDEGCQLDREGTSDNSIETSVVDSANRERSAKQISQGGENDHARDSIENAAVQEHAEISQVVMEMTDAGVCTETETGVTPRKPKLVLEHQGENHSDMLKSHMTKQAEFSDGGMSRRKDSEGQDNVGKLSQETTYEAVVTLEKDSDVGSYMRSSSGVTEEEIIKHNSPRHVLDDELANEVEEGPDFMTSFAVSEDVKEKITHESSNGEGSQQINSEDRDNEQAENLNTLIVAAESSVSVDVGILSYQLSPLKGRDETKKVNNTHSNEDETLSHDIAMSVDKDSMEVQDERFNQVESQEMVGADESEHDKKLQMRSTHEENINEGSTESEQECQLNLLFATHISGENPYKENEEMSDVALPVEKTNKEVVHGMFSNLDTQETPTGETTFDWDLNESWQNDQHMFAKQANEHERCTDGEINDGCLNERWHEDELKNLFATPVCDETISEDGNVSFSQWDTRETFDWDSNESWHDEQLKTMFATPINSSSCHKEEETSLCEKETADQTISVKRTCSNEQANVSPGIICEDNETFEEKMSEELIETASKCIKGVEFMVDEDVQIGGSVQRENPAAKAEEASTKRFYSTTMKMKTTKTNVIRGTPGKLFVDMKENAQSVKREPRTETITAAKSITKRRALGPL